MLDAIAVFIDSLPPNTTPSEIEIKYAFKCADGNGGWAGLSRTKGSPEKWRQALKSSNSGACELGVFHVSSVQTKNACASREFPYSSQTTQNATATGAAQTRVSVKFDTEQVVFDAPSTLEVSYLRQTPFSIILNSFDCQACITIVNAAFYDAIYHENSRRRFITNQNSSSRPPETKLFAHSVHGRLNMELDGEEYNKMRMLNPTVIYLEAIRIF